MKYIYDLDLNFMKEFCDFYEWNKEDIITHINKIISFKIKDKDMLNIKNNNIQIDETFLKKIYKKTKIYYKNKTVVKNYIALFITNKDVIAASFNKDGYNIMKSDIQIERQEEIINKIKNQKTTYIKYKIISNNKPQFKTRLEKEIKTKLINQLTKIYLKKEYDKLSYIYLECFNKNNNYIKNKYLKIKKEIIKGDNNFHRIFNIFKLINQTN